MKKAKEGFLMPKRFCVTGTCIPEKIYMIDMSFSAEAWTKEGILAAVKLLLKEPNTLFDDMTKKLL